MNIDQLQPGRELDALVGKHVMQARPIFEWWIMDKGENGIICVRDAKFEADEDLEDIKKRYPKDHAVQEAKVVEQEIYPCYSTSISDAWQVVEKLSKEYGVEVYQDANAPCECILYHIKKSEITAHADSAPLAICRAALKAILGGES